MSREAIINKLSSIAGTSDIDSSRFLLNSVFPNDIEYYLIAMELVNSSGTTEDYLMFPVMPDQISESVSKPVTVEKTLTGVSVNSNGTFQPVDISISGNFGVGLKYLVRRPDTIVPSLVDIASDPNAGVWSKIGDSYRAVKTELSGAIKTGWGAVRVLESIAHRDGELDKFGQPKKVLLYNSATGNNYVVKFISFQKSLSKQNYVMWSYDIKLSGVAPLEWYMLSQASRAGAAIRNLGVNAIQRSITTAAFEAKRILL